MPAPDLTVVVVTFRGRNLLPACLDSLATQTQAHQLLIVDNGSMDGSADLLAAELPADQRLRLDHNAGFAGGVAAALDRVRTRFVALLNDDAVANPGWLAALYDRAVSDDAGDRATAAWTSLLVHADRPATVQNAGAGLLRTGYGTDLGAGTAAANAVDAEVFGFCGGAALLRTDAVRAVGGFPAEFFLYYEDTDTSWRLRAAGWRIQRVTGALVRHAHSATSDQRSELFHRYNERNRLWMLLRNAPAGVAAGAVLRFVVTTVSVQARRLLRRPFPEAANLGLGLRLGVLAETSRALPSLLRQRRRLRRCATIGRAEIWREWAQSPIRDQYGQ